MKSTLTTMTLSLTLLTVAAGGILAGVNRLTEKPIAEAAVKARNEALAAVLPAFDNDISSTATAVGDGSTVFSATLGGQPAGMAVETFSDAGFGGRFVILAGFDAAGALTGYRVLSHAETPGLGAKMDTWFLADGTAHNIAGSTAPLKVKADGGDVDAITGATITSRAFLGAINHAREIINQQSDKR